MEALITYILKSAGILSIFYLVYIALLKRDTSFTTHRRFLIAGILASAILPSIYFTRKVIAGANNSLVNENILSTQKVSKELTAWFGIWEVLGSIYLLVAACLCAKIIAQLYGVFKLISNSNHYKSKGFKFIETEAAISPFSFFKYIVCNPASHSKKDLEIILLHEKIHASQLHSLDTIVANLITALLWFNPVSWLYKKSMLQNLEYIADKETVAVSGEKKSYQLALLKISNTHLQPAITNHFYQSFIKKRILMLNKKSPQQPTVWKVGLVFPLILAFMLTFNVKIEAKTDKEAPVEVKTGKEIQGDPIYILNGEKTKKGIIDLIDPKFILSMKVLKDESAISLYGEEAKDGVVIITTKVLNKSKEKAPGTKKKHSLGFQRFEKKSNSTNNFQINKNEKLSPLVIIDGKTKDKRFMEDELQPKDIENVKVLKGKAAIAKYGKKAKNGAIEITKKKDKTPTE